MGRDVQECRCCCFGLAKANLKTLKYGKQDLISPVGSDRGPSAPENTTVWWFQRDRAKPMGRL